MRYAVQMGSDAMIHVPSFIEIGSGIQKLNHRVTHTHTYKYHDDFVSLLSFFFFKIRRLKMLNYKNLSL
jgi:hypothetical protein